MTNSSLTTTAGRAIVLDIVGLQQEHLDTGHTPHITELLTDKPTAKLAPPFPAVTVPVQTTLATGESPSSHGHIANGEYNRDQDTVTFWDRDRGNLDRIWETARADGITTGVLFFQHLIGTTADVAVTPSPIEDDDNNLLEMNCWTNPDDFYDILTDEHGHFPLHHYWGPGANEQSSEWILTAAREAIDRYDPDLLWIYVPHLDYVGQRDGPYSSELTDALEVVDEMVGGFLDFLRADDRWDETVVNILSEYGFHQVDTPLFPNRVLREMGLLSTDATGDVDLSTSDAFAMVDHQIAHIYVNSSAITEVRESLRNINGVDAILDGDTKAEYGVGHPNAGDLVLIAEPNAWFQYYWWEQQQNAPPYAVEMDIHAKPGFDPCELFFSDTGLISLDPTNVAGSHGRVDEEGLALYGLGGPAAPSLDIQHETLDSKAVAPILSNLLTGEEIDRSSIFSM